MFDVSLQGSSKASRGENTLTDVSTNVFYHSLQALNWITYAHRNLFLQSNLQLHLFNFFLLLLHLTSFQKRKMK